MHPARRHLLITLFRLFDLGVMVFVYALAVLVSKRVPAAQFLQILSMPVQVGSFLLFALLIYFWHAEFTYIGLYRSRRISTLRREIFDILKATSLGTLVPVLAKAVFAIPMPSWRWMAYFFVASTVTIIASRFVLRYLLAWVRRHGRNLRYLLFVGTNRRAIELARKIEQKPDYGYKIVGFADESWSGVEEFLRTGYHVVCGLKDLRQYLRHHVIDEVMICLPSGAYSSEIPEIQLTCEEQGVAVRRLASERKFERTHAEELEGELLIGSVGRHLPGSLEGTIKRGLDIILSSIALVVLLPVLLATAVAVKLTSKGPVLFLQERVGLQKRRFRMYKFRTMVVDAEARLSEIEALNEVSGPVFKMENDPRVTPVGRFLRMTSLDELPQLINVLKGDMSLVGPRPLPVRDYAGFVEDTYRRRLSVRPGITCLWQVEGRNSIPFDQWMQLDLRYIDTWSLGLDFWILLKTIPAVLKGSGLGTSRG
jgi:exopolysaccharide biosynthesis polyprenyl glycosylphosphotransferase